MKVLKPITLIILSSAFLASSASMAKAAKRSRIDLDKMFKTSVENEPSVTVGLRYQVMGSKINHNETYKNSNFSSIGAESEMSTHAPGLELAKEFFTDSYVSVSMNARGAVYFGGGDIEKNLSSTKEEISGNEYGGGLSINVNTEGFGLKIQPFLGTTYIQSSTEYDLAYDANNSNEKTNLNYKYEDLKLQHSVGVRFIDVKEGLSSFLSMNYDQELDSTTDVSSNFKSQSLELNQTSKVEKNEVSFSFGLGLNF